MIPLDHPSGRIAPELRLIYSKRVSERTTAEHAVAIADMSASGARAHASLRSVATSPSRCSGCDITIDTRCREEERIATSDPPGTPRSVSVFIPQPHAGARYVQRRLRFIAPLLHHCYCSSVVCTTTTDLLDSLGGFVASDEPRRFPTGPSARNQVTNGRSRCPSETRPHCLHTLAKSATRRPPKHNRAHRNPRARGYARVFS